MKARRRLLHVLTPVLSVGLVLGAGPARPAAATVPATVSAEDPIVVHIESPPIRTDPSYPPFTVSETLSSGETSVVNPGGTVPTAQQCFNGTATNFRFCLGSSDEIVYPDDTELGPITITDAPTQESGLPGTDLDWIIDDAVSSVAQVHGVRADDLVRSYARPEIRAFVAMRLNNILDKKLYGEAMSLQEQKAYAALKEIYRTKLVNKAKRSLREYNLWSANPCGYPVPAAPTGSPYVANDVAASQACAPGQVTQAFKILNNTPPVEVFDAWATYRNPSPLLAHGADPNVVRMLGDTMDSYVSLGGLGAALAVGAAAGATITALNLALISIWYVEASANGVITWTLASGGVLSVVAAVVIAAIIAGIAIWKIIEDARPGEEIKRRVTDALKDDDPFRIEASKADYASLDLNDPDGPEDPTDPSKRAVIHGVDFTRQLASDTYEWMMFDGDGALVPDPLTGWNEAWSAPEGDLKLRDNTTSAALDPLHVLAPTGTRDHTGKVVSGYRVKVARGWFLVATLYLGEQTFGPYEPRLNLRYQKPDGTPAMVSLWRDQRNADGDDADPEADEPDVTRFLHTWKDDNGNGDNTDDLASATGDTWTLKTNVNEVRTVKLDAQEPLLPQTSVVPSADGLMIAGTDVRLKANASELDLGTTDFDWTIERLDEAGAVVETIPQSVIPENSPGFPIKLATPGRYRAIVHYDDETPAVHTSGRVEFTVLAPTPEVRNSITVDPPKILDDRVLGGSLSLDLRVLQNTPSDTFHVEVDWADDGSGKAASRITETYTVQCVNADENTCDTGPLPAPEPGQPPLNPQWDRSPTYRIPDGQSYLPQVTVRISNSHGQTTERVFPITGEHRPTYASTTPEATLVASSTNPVVDVVEVFPSPLLTESQDLTIQPYMASIQAQLPDGVHPDIRKDQDSGRWFLTLNGTPQADQIGTYTFFFPFEQEPNGSGLRPPPALATVRVVPANDPGYRAVIRNAPSDPGDRFHRNAWPNYVVQVAQVLDEGEDVFTPFTGTVKCKLVVEGQLEFDKPCQADKRFPWPTDRVSGTMDASVYVESASQKVSADGPSVVNLNLRWVDPRVTVAAASPNALTTTATLVLVDNTPIFPPYAGYTVTCSQDGAAFKACMGAATLSLLRTPGSHTLAVRVKAPDGATTTQVTAWSVATPAKVLSLSAPLRARRGARILVGAGRLLPLETYAILIGGKRVATGRADRTGKVSVRVVVPKSLRVGKQKVVVVGVRGTRKGVRTISVLR